MNSIEKIPLLKLNEYLKRKEAAEFLGVSYSTMRNWEAKKILIAYRHPFYNSRLYKKEDLIILLKSVSKFILPTDKASK